MFSNIREINIVSDKNTIKLIKKIIGNGSELGLKLSHNSKTWWHTRGYKVK